MSDAAAILQRLRQRQAPQPILVKVWLLPIGYVPPKRDRSMFFFLWFLFAALVLLAVS